MILFLVWSGTVFPQLKIASWNLQNFGKTKSEQELNFIANTIKDFDVVGLQEVVAGNGGSQAVAKLAQMLNRKGFKWEYSISDATESSPHSSERYAFLWKTSRVKSLSSGWLDENFQYKIEREPYFMSFVYEKNEITLVNFHAIPKKKQPETEIKYFKFLPGLYRTENLIFMGDFNIPQSHTVFFPLKKMGYEPVLKNQKTTMKMKCVQGECLASEYDNIFYNVANLKLKTSGIVRFYVAFPDMVDARRISDHIPIWAEFVFNEEKKPE
ncbi:MAG TPA: endonuclease/exonuclease/phosphatase family protein [Flavobacteriaceae bacterium]|nr:endonuclease/exonuclease/phosphatase family protein [Flavobacteriaceae bacterium]